MLYDMMSALQELIMRWISFAFALKNNNERCTKTLFPITAMTYKALIPNQHQVIKINYDQQARPMITILVKKLKTNELQKH